MTCKGKNCFSKAGLNHSAECLLEYAQASDTRRFEEFDRYYQQAGGSCLASAKQKHWETWRAAQEALLSSTGPAVQLSYVEGAINE